MGKFVSNNYVISGMGIVSAVGQGKQDYRESLWSGKSNFSFLTKQAVGLSDKFIGAEISRIDLSDFFLKKNIKNISFSGKVILSTVHEAWCEAKLDEIDKERIGIVIGGSNIQQRTQLSMYQRYMNKIEYIQPSYAFSFMDSDLCSMCTEQFSIKGCACSVGGASASGQLAVIQAMQAIEFGIVDVCIAVGAFTDLSFLECQALRNLGAMGSDRYKREPSLACRPFDTNSDGFIYGGACGAIVIESKENAKKRKAIPYAYLSGYGIYMDGNRNPNPSVEGEKAAIRMALKTANLKASDIEYINPHGSGSPIGDRIELCAFKECNLNHAFINTTKSITGHGLYAAGTVEIITTLLQMKESKLHPSINLLNPIDLDFNWVKDKTIEYSFTKALNVSIGFGGINTVLCLSKYD